MLVKDEAAMLPRTLPAVIPLIDHWTIVDTGSTDGTQEMVEKLLSDIPGVLHEREWVNFGHNRSELLALAKGSADWLLTLDADMEIEFHPGLPVWLGQDLSPHTDAWWVQIKDSGDQWWLPWLVRGHLDWWYEGVSHAGLCPYRGRRKLIGLTCHHLREGGRGRTRFEDDLELLREGCEAGEPRAVFYTAQTLRFLGRWQEAVALYDLRASMEGTFEEEAWYAQYQAAKIRSDVDGLLEAYKRRPWRHEPLKAAAAIVRRVGVGDDLLFIEP